MYFWLKKTTLFTLITVKTESSRGNLYFSATDNRKEWPLVRKKLKVFSTGDGHTRACAAELSHNLGETYEVTGFVQPGSGLELTTNTANEEIGKLTWGDIVVVCGDSTSEIMHQLQVLDPFQTLRKTGGTPTL